LALPDLVVPFPVGTPTRWTAAENEIIIGRRRRLDDHDLDGRYPAKMAWARRLALPCFLICSVAACTAEAPATSSSTGSAGPRPSSVAKTNSVGSPSPTAVAASQRTPELCGSLDYGVDGTVGPVLCRDGAANQQALDYFRTKGLVSVDLDAQASPTQVMNALCDDLNRRSLTIPVVQEAYQIGNAINGWNFGIDPSSDAQLQACH